MIVTSSASSRLRIANLSLAAAPIACPLLYRFVTTEHGGLISYGPDVIDQYYRAGPATSTASSRARSPPTCRCGQPTKFELVINLKTAKALGLDVPADAARPRRRGDRVSAPGKAGAILPVEVRPK